MEVSNARLINNKWRLEELGVNEEIIIQSILDGESARDECTVNDPNCFPGIAAWSRNVRSLRDQLIPMGWSRNDDKNYPTVISPDGKVAIAVATGDEFTGQSGRTPSTKYRKGAVTQDAINRNQYCLFPDPEENGEDLDDASRITWILLKRRARNVINFELSLPDVISKDGVIMSWNKRIFFEPMTLESEPFVDDDLFDEPIEIDVTKLL